MESKRKIVNGETLCECEFSVNELSAMYNALIRLWCNIDEKRAKAGDSPSSEFYYEKCEKLDKIIYKVDAIINP